MPHPGYAQLKDRDWLHQQYALEGRSLDEIAHTLGCSLPAVSRALAAHEIPTRTPAQTRALRGSPSGPTRRFPELEDRHWLEERYLHQELSTEEIGALLGCSGPTVWAALVRHTIPRRPAKAIFGYKKKSRIPELHNPMWLRVEYLEKDRTATQIAQELGCSYSTVVSMLSRHEIIKTRPKPQSEWKRAPRQGTKWKNGYLLIWQPEHPLAQGSGYVAEHRLVCEKAIGRYLTRQECVHHVNENPADNRLENLMVFPNNTAHMAFHNSPPAWVPRCPHCQKPQPEILTGRPDGVPLLAEGA
jgi:HNH endonuclease